MPNHLLLMSFNDQNFSNLDITLKRFFKYTFALTQKKTNIRMAFIGTAANDHWMHEFFFKAYTFVKFGKKISTSKLSLTTANLSVEQMKKFITSQDILFVGGGNTKNMLDVWQTTGFTQALNELKENDALPILAGVSAGGMYPFVAGISDYATNEYRILNCLNWLPYSFCPHADSGIRNACQFDNAIILNRMESYMRAIRKQFIPPGYAVPDDCMLHFYNQTFITALATRKEIKAQFVNQHVALDVETVELTSDNTRDQAETVLELLEAKYKPTLEVVTKPTCIHQ